MRTIVCCTTDGTYTIDAELQPISIDQKTEPRREGSRELTLIPHSCNDATDYLEGVPSRWRKCVTRQIAGFERLPSQFYHDSSALA